MTYESTNFGIDGKNRYVVHLICLLTTTVIVLTFHACVIHPLQRLQRSTRQESVSLDQLLVKANPTQTEYRRLQQAVSELKQRQGLLRQRIPRTPREASYLALVTETANQVGLTISNYRPGQVTSHDTFSEMELQLSAKGSYQAICRFIDGIETASRLTAIKQLTIDAKSTAHEYPIDMAIVLYFGISGQHDKANHRE